jgi:hypothetical protein
MVQMVSVYNVIVYNNIHFYSCGVQVCNDDMNGSHMLLASLLAVQMYYLGQLVCHGDTKSWLVSMQRQYMLLDSQL